MSSNNLEGIGLNIALDSRIYLFNYKLLLLTFVLDINYGLVTRSSNNLEGPRFNITVDSRISISLDNSMLGIYIIQFTSKIPYTPH